MKSSALAVALGFALAISGFGAGTAWAQGPAGPLTTRAALMTRQLHDLGAVHAYLTNKAPKAKAEAAAADLTETTRTIPKLFPPNSGGTSPDGKYATRPAIWSDWRGFLAAQDNAVHKAFALETAVKTGNKKMIAAAFADLGKNGCGGCHTKFREQLKQ
jgi:cytochrome c556